MAKGSGTTRTVRGDGYTKKTMRIARELNDLTVKYNDFRRADSEIERKYGKSEWRKANSYLD